MSVMKILFLTRYGRLGASSRMRSLLYVPWLEQMGIECTIAPLFDDRQLAKRYCENRYGLSSLMRSYSRRMLFLLQKNRFDLVWVEKEALPWLPAWFESWLLRNVPYVLDYDDALFHNYDLHQSAWVRCMLGQRIDMLMAGARLVICGNDYLSTRAQGAGASWVEYLPTVIDLERYVPKPKRELVELEPRIVWIGQPSTVKYMKLIHNPLIALSKRYTFRLRLIGARMELPGVPVEYFDWCEETEVASIQCCQIGVMPLLDSPWERGKCGYKLIQYMACGLPVVASPVGVNSVIVQENKNGFLANTEVEWFEILEKLLRDQPLRQQMGLAGRQRVEAEYCIQKTAPRLAHLLKTAGDK